jgi:hypothetical protein
VSDARVYEADGRLAVALTLDGSVKGLVYLWGTASISADGSTIKVKDLHLAPETERVLRQISGKLSTNLAALLTETTQSGMDLRIQEAVAQQSSTIKNRTYEKGDVIITVGDLGGRVLGVRPSANGNVIDVVLTGSASAVAKKKASADSPSEPLDCKIQDKPLDSCK